MADSNLMNPGEVDEETLKKLEEIDYSGRKMSHNLAVFIGIVAFTWSLFQLWIASPLPYDTQFFLLQSMPKRGIHLAFV